MSLESQRKILEALEFAAVKHQYLRRGGYDKLPYINHLIKVANLIQKSGLGEDTNLILIAILHDIIEDTDATHQELSTRFGTQVADAVLELTDDMDLSYSERKKRQVQSAPNLSYLARIIRLADKICNIRDIVAYPLDWTTEKKLNYMDNSLKVLEQIRGTNQILEDLLEKEVTRAKQKLKN